MTARNTLTATVVTLFIIILGVLFAPFASADHVSDGGVDEAWTNVMNQPSYWEVRFGMDCDKFRNHSGFIPDQYDAAVVKDGNMVRVYPSVGGAFTALGAVNPANNQHFGGPHSWVMKCKAGDTTTTSTSTTSSTVVSSTTTTTSMTTTTTMTPSTSSTTTVPGTTLTTLPAPTTTVSSESTTTTPPQTSTTPPESFCVDPNTASRSQLLTVQGITLEMAVAIISTTSFDGPFQSVADLQAVFGLGNQALEPVFPDWPGYLSDACLTVTEVSPSTTLVASPPPPTPASPTPALPNTGVETGGLVLAAVSLIGLGARLVRKGTDA